MEILIKASQFFLSLSILVLLHEMGHYLTARLFKTRVERFYLFFDPWFRLFKFKKGDTEYGMGWLPLGGYVKISGMIDESMDKEQMKKPPEPWEFRSKPAWQRLIIMLAGIIMNVILAILIYIVLLASVGEKYMPAENAAYGIVCDSLALEMGLRDGDKVITIDNKPVEKFNQITMNIILDNSKTIQVDRNGEMLSLPIPDKVSSELIEKKSEFINLRFPFVIGDFGKGSAAEAAGIQKDDRIIAINGVSTPYFDQFQKEKIKYSGKEVTLSVERAGATLDFSFTLPEDGIIGVFAKDVFEYKTKNYNILEAIPAGVTMAYQRTVDYAKNLRLIFTKERAYESVGGFITIGKFFPAEWDWVLFWSFTAFLSIILAFMNLLPIPALDGGHVMFLLWEIVTGRKPGDKFMEYAQIAGMALLFGLLLFANGNDIVKLFR
ncbi:MAG: RIP metalloprotease RseP [Bacteroidetes bacterium]|nr:RIP metalloprotease RseP [Bacteroidota bacterium]